MVSPMPAPSNQAESTRKVAVIGGGIAGSTAAFLFSSHNVETHLFESKSTLVSGPPFCHLHAGGSFYREISDSERRLLLEQSILIAKLFSGSVMYRPTLIVVPTSDAGSPEEIIETFTKVRQHYQELVSQNPSNAVLGDPSSYFTLFDRSDLIRLREAPIVADPTGPEDWIVPFAKRVDLDVLKFPVILVQEPGWNTLRQGAMLNDVLLKLPKCKLNMSTNVSKLQRLSEAGGYRVTFTRPDGTEEIEDFDYLVNAAGYRTGEIDDALSLPARTCSVEVKASYVIHWKAAEHERWPEVLFHGPRNTENGMAQLTPYQKGIFQLHGMKTGVTLFEEGLKFSDLDQGSMPTLLPKLRSQIEDGWQPADVEATTKRAVQHMSRFIPSIEDSQVAGEQPLHGAEQIPGSNPDARATSCSFIGSDYARIEIVKAVGAVDSAIRVWRHFTDGKSDPETTSISSDAILNMFRIDLLSGEESITKLALEYAERRGLASELAL